MVDMSTIQAIIPAGGEGSRLIPLTWPRAKSAVPIAGDSRLIAFMLTNLIRSGITQISIMAQKRPWSLKRYVEGFVGAIAPMLDQFIEVLTPPKDEDEFFASDRDSLIQSQTMRWLRVRAEYFLIVAGDQVVQIDFRPIAQRYFEERADCLLVYQKVPVAEAAGRLGVLEIDTGGIVTRFDEKPDKPTELPGQPGYCRANLAVLLVRKDLLIEMLRGTKTLDPVLTLSQAGVPWLLQHSRVIASDLDDNQIPGLSTDSPRFFRDISDPDTYYQTQLHLARRNPAIDLYLPRWRLLSPTNSTYLPAKVDRAALDQVLLGPDSVIQDDASIAESVISRGVIVGQGSRISRSVVLEGVRIGNNCRITDTIIEKDLEIPPNTAISPATPPSGTALLGQVTQKVTWTPIITPGQVLIVPKFYEPWLTVNP